MSMSDVHTLGHVALYARDSRWRRELARNLEETGHSQRATGSPEELHRLLTLQRFDVLALKVRDEAEAEQLHGMLETVTLPPHAILVGEGIGQLSPLQRRRRGTFRYVPSPLPARQVSRLVDVSLSAGVLEEGPGEAPEGAALEEFDLEDALHEAAATVERQARRKRQRLSIALPATPAGAYGDPAGVGRALAALLRLMVSIAPVGGLVTVSAEVNGEEWRLRFSAANAGGRPSRRLTQTVESLREEHKTLSAVSRLLKEQGGMLWVELGTPAVFALSITLPLPPGAAHRATA